MMSVKSLRVLNNIRILTRCLISGKSSLKYIDLVEVKVLMAMILEETWMKVRIKYKKMHSQLLWLILMS